MYTLVSLRQSCSKRIELSNGACWSNSNIFMPNVLLCDSETPSFSFHGTRPTAIAFRAQSSVIISIISEQYQLMGTDAQFTNIVSRKYPCFQSRISNGDPTYSMRENDISYRGYNWRIRLISQTLVNSEVADCHAVKCRFFDTFHGI